MSSRLSSQLSSVDVIVPCYRYGHYLRQNVASSLTQEGVAVRVLIIDDCSPDDSAVVAAELAREDARVTFIHHQTNHGHIATYNEGNDWASADYTILLSADDYLLPGALGRAARMLDAHPEMIFAFGKAQELAMDGSFCESTTGIPRFDQAKQCVLPGMDFVRLSGSRNVVSTPTPVVRTSILHRAGGYRPELPHAGDMEMWWRLASYGEVGFIGESQAVYRRHGSNMSHEFSFLWDLEQRQAAMDCFFAECADRIPDPAALRAHTRRALAADAARMGHRSFAAGNVGMAAELSAYAARTWPAIRCSLPWLKLAAKLQAGTRAVDSLKGLARWRG